MLSDYTFLTDHSYSLRPVANDQEELALKKPEEKTQKRRRSSTRTNQTTSSTNRTASIDRSSSDKENNSLILSSSSNPSLSETTTSLTTTKTKPIGSRRSRLSTRITMTNSRTQTGKKQDTKTSSKTGVKSTQGSIIKKKKVIPRGKTQLVNYSQMDSSDTLPSLSIEERVKLRRTKPVQPVAKSMDKGSSTKKRQSPNPMTKVQPVQKNLKAIRPTILTKKIKATKTTKSFLGSGLDLDNIVLGNRQRRCVQT